LKSDLYSVYAIIKEIFHERRVCEVTIKNLSVCNIFKKLSGLMMMMTKQPLPETKKKDI